MKQLFNKKVILSLLVVIVLITGVIAAGPMLARYFDTDPEDQNIARASTFESRQISTNQQVETSSISKNETVYAKIKANGEVKDTTVVSWFHFSKEVPARLNDPAKLNNVKALNGSFAVKNTAEGVELSDLEEGKKDLFYSGQTDKTLPLAAEIQYFFNGKQVKPEELPGKTGDVKIIFDLHNQMSTNETINNGTGASTKKIYTPLMTMISMELPIETFSDVEAPDGIVTVVGETMKVNWMLFPYPEAQAVLTMHAEDFELGCVQMVVQAAMPPLSDYEGQKSKLEELNNGLTEMDAAMQQVETGSEALANGQSQIRDGLVQIQQGTGKLILLAQAQEKMASGALLINNGLLQAVQPYESNPMAADMVKPMIAALQKQQEVLKTMVEGGTINDQQVPPMSTTGSSLQMAQTALGKLADGTDKSASGARQMHDALGQIRSQGVQKMQTGVNESLQELNTGLGQIRIMENKVNSFNTFAGKDQNVKGSVQFIIQTDELK